ncbi:MAG: DUF1127 domain-containing protein [Pseudomonadota bacterium]
MAQIKLQPLAQPSGIGAGGVFAGAFSVVRLVLRWADRATQRSRLVELDERMLKDIGISREDAKLEARRPFWQ